jgi:hypothetical protein
MSALSSLFISHSSRDHAIAMEVGRRLRAEGYTDLFLDFDPVMTLIESAQSCSVKLLTGDRRLL